jgi:hypothetical protein
MHSTCGWSYQEKHSPTWSVSGLLIMGPCTGCGLVTLGASIVYGCIPDGVASAAFIFFGGVGVCPRDSAHCAHHMPLPLLRTAPPASMRHASATHAPSCFDPAVFGRL